MLNKKTGLIALLASVAASGVWAGTLANYAAGDVLLCFRKSQDMVVDIGQISTLTNLSANQRYSISTSPGAQLAQMGGTNAVNWSAFSWAGDGTLYVTRARTSLNAQSAAWQAKSSASQLGTAGRMGTIPAGALDELNLLIYSTTPARRGGGGQRQWQSQLHRRRQLSRCMIVPYGGNFNGTFVGNPENTTPNNFVTAGNVVRSDFYRLSPTAGVAFGTLLGYFELNTNGAMTYVAYPSATPRVIDSVSRTGNQTTITYTTGLYGTYKLRE